MPVTATPATLEAWISKVAAAEPIRLHLNGLKAPARAAVAAEIARSGADRVWVLTPDALAARRLAEVFRSVAVLCCPDEESSLNGMVAEHPGGGEVSVIDAASAKGLEFDAVVLVEPAAIVDAWTHGARVLYVALTRAVQQLHIIHARPLPADLG